MDPITSANEQVVFETSFWVTKIWILVPRGSPTLFLTLYVGQGKYHSNVENHCYLPSQLLFKKTITYNSSFYDEIVNVLEFLFLPFFYHLPVNCLIFTILPVNFKPSKSSTLVYKYLEPVFTLHYFCTFAKPWTVCGNRPLTSP